MAKGSSGKRKRVQFRRNRQKPARQKQWSVPTEDDEHAEDAATRESVQAKGDLSRKRTVIEHEQEASDADLRRGIAVAVRGQFVDVDDGQRVWPCTVRRILRTRLIKERSPVTVGDEVAFRVTADEDGVLNEGVIEQVGPRRSTLTRCDGRRTHVIAANVDQVLIVSAIREPRLKPHLIDRYLVAAHAGGLDPIVCITKIDLGAEDEATEILERYRRIGYRALWTSTETGVGLDELRSLLADKVTLLAGQSGVGKSSLLNAVEPGLNLATSHVSTLTEKGRHTTTTARWIKLTHGCVVDTPGIRALDVAMVPLNELETHFVEFLDRISDCHFPNCSHIHEKGCAILAAVEAGDIQQSRYESYLRLFEELSETHRATLDRPDPDD